MNAIRTAQPRVTTIHPSKRGFTLTPNTNKATGYTHCGKGAYQRIHWQQNADGVWHSITIVKCVSCGTTNIVTEAAL